MVPDMNPGRGALPFAAAALRQVWLLLFSVRCDDEIVLTSQHRPVLIVPINEMNFMGIPELRSE